MNKIIKKGILQKRHPSCEPACCMGHQFSKQKNSLYRQIIKMAEKFPSKGVSQQGVLKQWVSRVTKFSSQYDSTSWSADQVIGEPKVYPQYGDIQGAWASGDIDENQYIEVEFPEAVFISGIDIYETYHAGGVKAILGQNDSGRWQLLYSVPAVQQINTSRIFSPTLQDLGSRCRNIRIEIDCTACGTWVEIDAVQLHGRVFKAALPPPPKQLSNDMKGIINDRQFSDVEFLVDFKTVFAHKAILCARSEYFRAMFCDKLKESMSSAPIKIKDVTYEAFMAVINYIYTNDIPATYTCDQMPDVWRVADRFSLEGLKLLAAYNISEMLNHNNVVDTYVSAVTQLPVMDDVRDNCLAFMSSNISSVVNTPSFAKLPQDLMLEIIQQTTSKLKI